MKEVEVDILIVGAGPVGLYGAYYAGARGLSVAVVDSLSQLGGQVTAMYPEKQIYDIAGLPAVSGRELVKGLVAQANQYEPTYILGHEAQDLGTDGDRPPDRDHQRGRADHLRRRRHHRRHRHVHASPAPGRRGVPRPRAGLLRP